MLYLWVIVMDVAISPTIFETDVLRIATPAVVIDAAVALKNIRRMAHYASTHRLQLRPHTKTHKSIHLARLQVDAGAAGLTVAKVGEAQVMAEVSQDLLVAYPAVDENRSRRLAALGLVCTVRVAVDTPEGIESLGQAARLAGGTIGILVDLDVGMGRTGAQSAEAALGLALLVERTRGVRLDGLFCYPGHVWSPSDMNTVRGGFCAIDDCAARIVCTVVSNAVPGKVVIDAGSKTLTSDRCVPAPDSGHGHIIGYPQAKIVRLTEEHGEVDIRGCDRAPKIGDRVTVIPNHICPCINLQEAAWLKWPDGILEPLVIDARGKVS